MDDLQNVTEFCLKINNFAVATFGTVNSCKEKNVFCMYINEKKNRIYLLLKTVCCAEPAA